MNHRSLRALSAGLLALLLTALLALLSPLPVHAGTVEVRTAEELREALAKAGAQPTTISIAADITTGTSSTALKVGSGSVVTFTGTGKLIHAGEAVSLTVAKGARAVFDKGFEMTGPSPRPANSRSGIVIAGTGEMLDGARIHGLANIGTQQAPVSVVDKGEFTMRGGAIEDNEAQRDAVTAAGGVRAVDSAKLALLGGHIRNNTADGAGAYPSAGGVLLINSGGVVIDGASITGNRALYGGGVHVYNGGQRPNYTVEQFKAERVRVEFKSGTISNNTAVYGGGGISLAGNAAVTMSGGTITGNSAPGGGGVNAMDLCYAGGPSGQRQDYMCAAYKISPEDWPARYPGEFTMTGGTISKNTASKTGGGINVVSNRVSVTGGTIEANTAGLQGGGLYVTTVPYRARIDNAVVTGNTATAAAGFGGGIWSCPTGDVEMNINKGIAVYANRAEKAGDDFASELYGSHAGQSSWKFIFHQRMLGGGANKWAVDGNPNGADVPRYDAAHPEYAKKLSFDGSAGLKNTSSDDARALAKKQSRLLITGNSAPRGGGIGTNGGLVFGEPGSTHISVEKLWKGAAESFDMPDEVTFDLVRTYEGVDYVIDSFTVKKADGWQAVITNLPTKDSDGKDIDYSVSAKLRETSTGQWKTVIGAIAADGEGYAVTATNTVTTPPPSPTPTPTPSSPTPTPTPSNPTPPAPSHSTPPGPIPPGSEGPHLPRTGADAVLSIIAAVGFISAGTAVLILSRRRRMR